jgi:hypothetical protein
VKVNSNGYGGRKLKKNITVRTNDDDRPILNLTVTGPVEKFVTLIPRRLVLRGEKGKPLTGTVKIIPEKKYPFTLEETEGSFGKNLRYVLRKVDSEQPETYLLTVENLRKKVGSYQEEIHLKTNHELHPEIKIKVYVNIFKP